MPTDNHYLSVTLDDLPEPILIVLKGNTKQSLFDESNAILKSLGSWCDAWIVTNQTHTIIFEIGDSQDDE